MPKKEYSLGVKFDKRDIWIGAFWEFFTTYYMDDPKDNMWVFDMYVCILPMLPIHFKIKKGDANFIR